MCVCKKIWKLVKVFFAGKTSIVCFVICHRSLCRTVCWVTCVRPGSAVIKHPSSTWSNGPWSWSSIWTRHASRTCGTVSVWWVWTDQHTNLNLQTGATHRQQNQAWMLLIPSSALEKISWLNVFQHLKYYTQQLELCRYVHLLVNHLFCRSMRRQKQAFALFSLSSCTWASSSRNCRIRCSFYHLNLISSSANRKKSSCVCVFSQEVQWRRAVEVSLQWCFSHNFSVRLYALLALKSVWELEDARVLMEDNLGGLTTVVQACLQQGEAMQNTGWEKIHSLNL